MFGLGTREIIILAFILVLFFGQKKIPELARNIGEAGKHIKDAFTSDDKEKAEEKNQMA